MIQPLPPLEWDPQTIQLKGFSRGVAEIQWLLVALVLLYFTLVDYTPSEAWPALAATAAYFLFSLGAHFLARSYLDQRWLLAVHTWVMIVYISGLLYATDGVDGPLVGLYLLAVITSALALGRLATLLEVATVAACYLLLLFHSRGLQALAGDGLATPAAHVVMFLLVGYLTTVLADAIHLANERLRVLAHTDGLTGLYNRSTLRAITMPLYAGAIRDGRPFCVLVADLDNLKAINDRLGHDKGDLAIVTMAQVLRTTLRRGDIIARYGGDEFVAFLPNTEPEDARQKAQRLLDTLAGYTVEDVPLRVSVGLAGFPAHGNSVDDLLIKADRAMYAAKEQGGHAVHEFTP